MPRYDFKCLGGHLTERRVPMSIRTIPCPVCGEESQRVPFYVTTVIVTETGVGSGYGRYKPVGSEIKDKNGRIRLDLFQEATDELDHSHKKAEEIAGKPLPRRNYYKEGMARAKALMAAGYDG